MATIVKRMKKDKNNNDKLIPTYTARIRVKGYPDVTKTFLRREDAKQWAGKTEAEIHERINFPKRRAQKYTVGDIIDRFIKNEVPKRKPHAQRDMITALNWFKNEIGQFYLSGITAEILTNCREKLSHKPKELPIKGQHARESNKTLCPASVNKYMAFMSVVFSYCVNELEILDINPMSKVKKLKVDNARERYLSKKEIDKLLDACKCADYELFLCVLIALLTGARKSEVLKLTWATVDFEHKCLYFLKTKNGKDRGEPMPDILYNELLKYRNQSKIRHLQNDYIFKTVDGKPKESLIGKLFPKIVKKAGIKDCRFHDLRHTQASWQAMSGISQAITQKTLGHKTPAMTNRYSHLRAESLRPYLNTVSNTMLEEYFKSAAGESN